MQSVSSGFSSAATAKVRYVSAKVTVQWNGETWVDESDNILHFTYDHNLDVVSPIDSRFTASRARLVLRNKNNRYSAYAVGGDNTIRSFFSSNEGVRGVAVRLYVGLKVSGNYEWVRVFTGVIKKVEEDAANNTVTFTLVGKGDEALQKRKSTPLVQDTTATEWIRYLGETYLDLDDSDMVLSTSSLRIPWAWLDDDSIMEEIWDTAISAGGWAYFDQSGKLHFEQRSDWMISPKDTPVITLTDSDYVDLTPYNKYETLATQVVVEFSPRNPGLIGDIYINRSQRLIKPGEEYTFEVRLDSPAVAVFTPNDNDYRLVNAAGLDISSQCDISIVPYAQRVEVTIKNNNTVWTAILDKLHLRGIPLVGAPSDQVSKDTVADLPYDRIRSLRGNLYVQTQQNAEFLAEIFASHYGIEQRVWSVKNLKGLPHLEIGDRVRISDDKIANTSQEGFVISIHGEFNNGFSQNIDLISSTVWDVDDLFLIGQTALGSGEAWY